MPKVGRSTGTWVRLREQCWRRDKAANAPCHICGQRTIRYDLAPSSDPDAWEPDHIIPVDAHPELAEVPDNIGASHRRCNRAKGKKAGIDNLGARSRDWARGDLARAADQGVGVSKSWKATAS